MSPDDVDVNANKHTGQIALRKLYHESPRPIVVLYTAKTCGPCRTLKPILNSVADEYGNQAYPPPPPPPPLVPILVNLNVIIGLFKVPMSVSLSAKSIVIETNMEVLRLSMK